MSRFPLAAVALLVAAAPLAADPARTDLLPSSPGVAAGALGGLANPAVWGTAQGELAFAWDDRSDFESWTVAVGSPLGFGLERSPETWRYRVGFADGGGKAFRGIGWSWSTGADGAPEGESGLSSGLLLRPWRQLSLGQASFVSAESGYWSLLFDAGIRPLGTSAVTLFADWSLERDRGLDERRWSAGAEWRPFRGLHLGARVRELPGSDDLETLVNVGLTIDGLGYHELTRLDADGSRVGTRRIVRVNPPHHGVPFRRFRESRSPRRLVPVNLERKTVSYRKDLWFDEDRVAWLDLSRILQRAREDPTVVGVAVNLSAARIRPSILWEMRRELAAIRAAGKRVIVQIERPRMSHYYLASVADRLQMDPYGWLELTGLAWNRTYWKGLLDKLGIGFQEFRHFTYKSAVERYTRTDMSDVDREQIGRMTDVIWNEWVGGISEGRAIPREEVARLGDDEWVLTAAIALDAGLVDAEGRWEDVKEWAREEGFRLAGPLRPRATPEERWGSRPKLALVYASGPSEMDSGFRGRATGEHLRKLAKRADVAAVVLRADSPGGSPMAADCISRGMAAIRKSGKPLVVTQGDVAASAGYSICLESDRIYTTPLTITGSIGVIAGWAWDAGLGEKTGFSADGVQRGIHADLLSGVRIPFVGTVPQRSMNDAEQDIMRARILEGYDRFVAHVATGRDLPDERVREIAEGRVWIGGDAIERKLVDDTGSLADALADARVRAGIAPGEEISIEEFPPRRRFSLPRFLPGLPSLALGIFGGPSPGDRELEDRDDPLLPLRPLLDHPGEPLQLVPPGQLPDEWRPDGR